MITINEYIKCNECGARFNANELIMGSANDDHGIDEWFCPACGGANYDITFEDETESW